MATLTPVMQQYMTLKEKHKDCVLLFRLGDFYEMFFDDAVQISKELELTLTARNSGLEERAPMCGVPYHALNHYLEKLLANGHRVAICEQLEDPALTKDLVKRDVVRIVTPGTVSDPAMLDERTNSYLMAVCFSGSEAGLAFADVSTGECYVHQVEQASDSLADEIARIDVSEIITPDADRLAACRVTDLSRLRPGAMGIPEPDGSCPEEDPAAISLLLIPGLAFDRMGRRLGQGGGFYDRFLPGTRGLRVGVCGEAGLVERVPTEPWDEGVDALLTPQAFWIVKGEGHG